jgi:site-specific recombinase XerC
MQEGQPTTHIVEAESKRPLSLAEASRLATRAVQATVLKDYRQRKAPETLRRQRADLAAFEQCLTSYNILVPDGFSEDLSHWQDIEYGLVELFVRWQVQQGYAPRTIAARLSTVKVYCRLAVKAGHLSLERWALIRTVESYRGNEAANLDQSRQVIRRGRKKPLPVEVTTDQLAQLKDRPDTPVGRRDLLIVCLVFDHILRCSEVADLNVASLQLQTGKLIFYRQKTPQGDSHDLTADTLRAASAYLTKDRQDASPDDPLFVGKCSKERINVRSVRSRIQWLGFHVLEITNLTPHDGRHFGTFDALENGTTIDRLQSFGGWSTPARPLEYARRQSMGNRGVKLTVTSNDSQLALKESEASSSRKIEPD